MTAPRAYLFTRPLATRIGSSTVRSFTSSSLRRSNLPFKSGPAPPRLPEEEQKIFEELQRQSTGAFSTPLSQRSETTATESQRSFDSSGQETTDAKSLIAEKLAKLRGQSSETEKKPDMRIDTEDEGETLHPNFRHGAQPEFEGDVNPKTGEVGGPKNEPLRWGSEGEWTYNGRTTDF